ncbi:uncharacterized protein LOC117646062 isoform X2 [Thrips palmi]|nr:uncharacterized protein LOC117646062 isoform X2 [Thrips palmi]
MNVQNGSREASPARVLGVGSVSSGNFLTAPNSGRGYWSTSPGQLSESNMKHMSSTYGGVQRINGTNGTNGTDQTDATGNFNVKRISDQRNRWLESTLSPSEKNNDYQKVLSVIESKSERHGFRTETSMETRYELNSRSRSTVVSSTSVTSSSSHPQQYSSSIRSERIIPMSIETDSSLDRYSKLSDKKQGYTNGSASHQTPVSSKSFIQQRVERLYGPCALAQGFFHRSCKSSYSFSPNLHGANGVSNQTKPEEKTTPDKTEDSPELPVLRHLRPEFRDQLTVAPRRSLGSRFSDGSTPSPSNFSAPGSTVRSAKVETLHTVERLQHQTSTESLADLQPAAPEVVLPQQSPSVSPMSKEVNTPVVLTTGTADISNVVPVEESKFSSKPQEEPSLSTAPRVPILEENEEENAGHKFLKIQRQTIEKLLELAAKAEKEIEENGSTLSEEALGHLRAAAGQARLLVNQKMVQFEGLCRKCINQRPEEQFPTTPEDLQGFWDMLLLQVDQVHNTFHRLDKLKAVGWCEDKLAAEDKPKSIDNSGTRTPSSSSKRTTRTPKASTPSAAKSAEAAALRKQREEERRKLMEQRRKELKQKQQTGQESSESEKTVEIFGAELS